MKKKTVVTKILLHRQAAGWTDEKIITHVRNVLMVVSPTNLFGCPASFQRLVELAMRGWINVIVYIDDLLLHWKSHAE